MNKSLIINYEQKIVCDNMNLNKDNNYELNSNCNNSKSICKKYLTCKLYIEQINSKVFVTNIQKNEVKKSSKLITKQETEVLKLLSPYIRLTSRKSKSRNKQLIRRIEQMNLNNEEIKTITL